MQSDKSNLSSFRAIKRDKKARSAPGSLLVQVAEKDDESSGDRRGEEQAGIVEALNQQALIRAVEICN